MYQLQKIVKQYNGAKAVDSIDLAIAPGKTTVLIGPSGCGKSTLLRLMVGLIWQDSGQIIFDGEEVFHSRIFNLRVFNIFASYLYFSTSGWHFRYSSFK